MRNQRHLRQRLIARKFNVWQIPLEPLEVRRLLSTVFVDLHATGANNGSSWNNAYTSLQSALGTAVSGETIEVAQGTYTPGNTRSSTFQLLTGVSLLGGYAANPSAPRNVSGFQTILSGDIGVIGSAADNCYHVVTTSGTSSTADIDGFTISGGNADHSGDSTSGNGGGLYNANGNAVINNCTFTNNTSSLSGGALYTNQGSPLITNCIFTANSSASFGGAMSDIAGDPSVADCLFYSNVANGNDDGGGALVTESFQGTFANCTFTMNSAPGTLTQGGAVYNANGRVEFASCIFWNDSATFSSEIYNPMGFLQNSDSIQASDAEGGVSGGGIISADPLFVNPGADNFQLQIGSPCVNAGVDVLPPGITTDLAGNPRIVSSAIDMGAYESQFARGVFVDAGATGSNNGTSWANAYTSLSSALANAVSGENIEVAQGTYTPTTADDPTATFTLHDGVNLLGGFRGGAVSPDTRNVTLYPSILSGNLTGNGNSYHVVTADAVNSTAVIDGFTITGGWANGRGGGYTYDGGGMLVLGASPVVNDCTFSTDSARSAVQYATGAGGALADIMGSDATITNCSFVDNYADQGGAFDNDVASSASLVNCSFDYDGGTALAGSNVTVTDCSFSGDYGTTGGAASLYKSIATGCTFSGNSAITYTYNYKVGGGYGGAVDAAISTITDCSFSHNTAGDGGGAIYAAETECIDCSFIANSAVGVNGIAGGGAVQNIAASSFLNCVFSGNTSYRGGAIFDDNSSDQLTNCTFSGNSAYEGGAILNDDPTASVIANSIFWGDTAVFGPEIYIGSGATPPTITFTDFDGGYSGTGNINTDPLFVSNPNPANGWFGKLELQTGSLPIDQGSNAALPTNDAVDILGYPRVANGTVDMGAYEFQPGLLLFDGLGGGTEWPDPFDWSTNNLPTASSNVAIELSNNPTVDLAFGAQAIHSAVSTDPVVVSGGSLSVGTTFQISASFSLTGGDILGGTYVLPAGQSFLASGGTLSGVTINGNLTVAPSSTLTIMNSLTLNGVLNVGAGAVIDLTTGSLAINYGAGNPSPLASVKSDLASGSIFSSTANANPRDAVGYADGNADTGTAAQPGQVLVKYTLNGDTNLDGLVNFADLVTVLQNFNKGGTDWAHGNFAGGPSTNFADLVAVLQNYNKTLTPPAAGDAVQTGSSTIPLAQSATIQTPRQTAVASTQYQNPQTTPPPADAINAETDLLDS